MFRKLEGDIVTGAPPTFRSKVYDSKQYQPYHIGEQLDEIIQTFVADLDEFTENGSG